MKEIKTQQKEIKAVSRTFTLIEILIVCALIAMLTAIAVTGFSVAMQKASEADTRSIITQIEIAMDGYKAKYGFFLPSKNGKGDILKISDSKGSLSEFIPTYKKWQKNGTINNTTLTDPYGTAFWFRSPGSHNHGGFDIESAGADTQFGYSEISNHDKNINKDTFTYKGRSHTTNDLHIPGPNSRTDAIVDNINNWTK